jgi:hypothetical protein
MYAHCLTDVIVLLQVGNVSLNESMGAIDYVEMAYKGQGTELYPSSDLEKLAVVLQRKNEVR